MSDQNQTETDRIAQLETDLQEMTAKAQGWCQSAGDGAMALLSLDKTILDVADAWARDATFLLKSEDPGDRDEGQAFRALSRDLRSHLTRARGARGASGGSDGALLIAQERVRQVAEEGYGSVHDDHHSTGELAMAAACYASPVPVLVYVPRPEGYSFQDAWPWDGSFDKRSGAPAGPARIRDLAKAGALIAAEIDRLMRLEKGKK